MCVIIAITLINHHHHHSGHHHRHVLDEIKTHSQWQSVLLRYIFFSTKRNEKNKVEEKNTPKLLHHCFPASPCSPGFDKSCWMLFLKLTSSRFILSVEEVEVNREGRYTWNSFISVKDPLLKRTEHRVHRLEYRLCRQSGSQKSTCHLWDEQLSSTNSDRAPPTPLPLTFTHLSTAGRQSAWWGVT